MEHFDYLKTANTIKQNSKKSLPVVQSLFTLVRRLQALIHLHKQLGVFTVMFVLEKFFQMSYAHQGCIYIKHTVKTLILLNINHNLK